MTLFSMQQKPRLSFVKYYIGKRALTIVPLTVNLSCERQSFSFFLLFFSRLLLVIPECSQYKLLRGYDRHRNYYSLNGKECDSDLTEGWYRFYGNAGNVMASSCVSTHRCNTDLTGWMQGSLPTVDEGAVLRKVCFNGFGRCCFKHIEINVRNCGPFYVYRLTKLTFCTSRYCGSNQISKRGSNW